MGTQRTKRTIDDLFSVIAAQNEILKRIEVSLTSGQRKKYLDTKEAAQYLSLSESTVRHYISTGRIRATKVKNCRKGKYRIPQEEIENFMLH